MEDFYGLIEKTELKSIINMAKKVCVKDALLRLKNFDPATDETFMSALMPDDTPKALIKKRTNKLLLKKREKELKRLFG